MRLAQDDLTALTTLLQGQDYLTGSTPTEADCALFGFLDVVRFTVLQGTYML